MRDCHSATKGNVIAIDGKTVRGSYDKSNKRGAIHMVSAFCAANEVVIGQVKTAEKSDEITAIPELLVIYPKHSIVNINGLAAQNFQIRLMCISTTSVIYRKNCNSRVCQILITKH